MQSDSVEKAYARRARLRRAMTPSSPQSSHARSPRARTPSPNSYLLAAGAAAATLFFLLWWMLHTSGDEAPWIPAGLAASVVMLVALAAREVVMRRAWTRYLLEHDRREQTRSGAGRVNDRSRGSTGQLDSYAAALRTLKRQAKEADAQDALPEAHLDTYFSCQEYLDSVDESLRSGTVRNETRIALRSGCERVRALARHHLLHWARQAAHNWTHEAQQRVRVSDKIETAQRALEVINSALNRYPDEKDLRESEAAVHEFVASVKVSHWVELAERSAFKGHLRRAIDRYRDALYFLSRANMNEETRMESAERIGREIDLLRARLTTQKILSKTEG